MAVTRIDVALLVLVGTACALAAVTKPPVAPVLWIVGGCTLLAAMVVMVKRKGEVR